MADYISREAARNGIYNCPTKTDADGYIWVRTKDVAHMIDDIPAADVRLIERIKKFFHKKDLREICREKYGDDFIILYDKLGSGEPIGNIEETIAFINMIEEAHFCPNCGADMRGGADDG